MVRVALGIEYCGARYAGWQRQAHCASVQGHLEIALSKIANHPVVVHGAGRTDAGVHATHQVIHIDAASERPDNAWVRGTNTHLPPDIRVLWSKPVSEDFHARFSALKRTYLYLFLQQPVSPGIFGEGVTWIHTPLDVPRMQQAASYLVGKHDFSAFRAAGCQAKTATRQLEKIQVGTHQNHIYIEVTANAFLHHMVRNIAGSLLSVGKGFKSPDWLKSLLNQRDRRLSGITAPANGLYFVHVCYPDEFNLPSQMRYPWFVSQ